MLEILILKVLFIILHWVKLEKPILWLSYFLETATSFFLFYNLKQVRVYNFWWKPSIAWYFDCINLFINYMILYVRRNILKFCHEVYKIVEQVWFNLIVSVEQWTKLRDGVSYIFLLYHLHKMIFRHHQTASLITWYYNFVWFYLFITIIPFILGF